MRRKWPFDKLRVTRRLMVTDKKKIPREGRRTGENEEVRVFAQIRFEILDIRFET
jgi:hypothetical protein